MEKTDHPYHFPKNVKELQESWKTYWIKIGILQMAVNMYLTECLLTGCIAELLRELNKYLLPVQFLTEKESIGRIQPFSFTKDWAESSVQIFTDKYFIEIFHISMPLYKLYVDIADY